ncbi:MAG TPA: glycosyltransferase family 1 protein [Thermoleophilaceae bacterium]
MRVGIDATGWADRRGLGRFTRNAVSSLVELDRDNSYVLYVGSEGMLRNGLPAEAEKRLLTAGQLVRMGADVSRDRLDAFLFPSVASYFPVTSVPTLVGVHDVPSQRPSKLVRSLKARLAVRHAARVFTVSVSSRASVASRFGIPTSRLSVVPQAADPVFHPRTEWSRGVVERLELEPGRFIVYAAGLDPHKDVETLLLAHARLCRRGGEAPILVLAGDLEERGQAAAVESIRGLIAELGTGSSIVLPGFVPDEELADLYSACGAVAIPSLAESFGLPAVEAAACGAALVLSELPVHRENLDGAALFFKPGDVEGLEHRLAVVLGNPEMRRGLESDALERARKLTWKASAQRLRTLVTEIAAA